jgi:FtsP/CotA-like multicopper oxidase with cupredoxin domain
MQEEGKLNWDADQKVPPPPGWPPPPAPQYRWPQHPCIQLDHNGSHKQLWVLTNFTSMLHNFHIHQMKFRLATKQELKDHHIIPPEASHTCTAPPCTQPDYKLYDDRQGKEIKQIEWHDTIPVPEDLDKSVFIIMSFDDAVQIGRFVYHCHILKHEDTGLMAPIEVWGRP